MYRCWKFQRFMGAG